MPELLCDPLAFASTPVLADLATVHERIPQRHEMALLHGILTHDPETRNAVGFHDAGEADFWVRGHIPGRPVMPGVVMVEIAAQLCAWISTFDIDQQDGKFFGFGGINRVRFRGTVKPGDRMLMACRVDRIRRSTANFTTQGFVDGKLVYEGGILGVMV